MLKRGIKHAGVIILARNADEDSLNPQMRQVAGDIGGTAGHVDLLPTAQNRDRCLRRNPADAAADKPVEHDITDNGDPPTPHPGEDGAGLSHRSHDDVLPRFSLKRVAPSLICR